MCRIAAICCWCKISAGICAELLCNLALLLVFVLVFWVELIGCCGAIRNAVGVLRVFRALFDVFSVGISPNLVFVFEHPNPFKLTTA